MSRLFCPKKDKLFLILCLQTKMLFPFWERRRKMKARKLVLSGAVALVVVFATSAMAQTVPAGNGTFMERPTTAGTTSRYNDEDDEEVMAVEIDSVIQELNSEIDNILAMKSSLSASPGTYDKSYNDLKDALGKYESWLKRVYSGHDPRLTAVRDAAAADVEALQVQLDELSGNVDNRLEGLSDELASLQGQINSVINDAKIAKYAFFTFRNAPREFPYSGRVGLQEATEQWPQMANVYCVESKDLWALLVSETHGAVHCVLNITGDANNQLFVAYKGRYQNADGSFGATMRVVEGGAIFKTVKYHLAYNRVSDEVIGELQRSLADPGVYERKAQVPGGLNAVSYAAKDKKASKAPVNSTSVTPSGSKGATALKNLDLGDGGNAGAIASDRSNAGNAGRDNVSVQVRAGSGKDVKVDVGN